MARELPCLFSTTVLYRTVNYSGPGRIVFFWLVNQHCSSTRAPTGDTLADFGNEGLHSPFITGARRSHSKKPKTKKEALKVENEDKGKSFEEETAEVVRRREAEEKQKTKKKSFEEQEEDNEEKLFRLSCTLHRTTMMMGTTTTTYPEQN